MTMNLDTRPTHIEDLPVADLFRWLVSEKIPLTTAATLTGLGFETLPDITSGSQLGPVFESESRKLSARGMTPPVSLILEHLLTVGHRVLAEDLPNIEEWVSIGERVRAIRFAREPYGRASVSFEVCNAFMDAGRSPSFAAELMTAAEDTGLSPLTFGLDREITTSIFRSLIEAGVRDLEELDSFRSNGLTIVDAVQLAAAGVVPGAVNAAVAAKLPRSQWAAALSGLPREWFPSLEAFGRSLNPDPSASRKIPDALGMMAIPGATWDGLQELARNGWVDAPARVFETNSWKNDAIHFISIDDALLASRAGIGFGELEKFMEALTLGKTGHYDWRSPTLPPISFPYGASSRVADIVRLRALGVRHTWVAEFRACGARNIDDLLTIAELGVTKARAAALRAAHGQNIHNGQNRTPTNRFPALRDFLVVVPAAGA
jgi:hypothetical protein